MFACSSNYPTDLDQTGHVTLNTFHLRVCFILNIIHREPEPLCLYLRPYWLSFTPIAFSSRYWRPSSHRYLVNLTNHLHIISRSRAFISLHVVIAWCSMKRRSDHFLSQYAVVDELWQDVLSLSFWLPTHLRTNLPTTFISINLVLSTDKSSLYAVLCRSDPPITSHPPFHQRIHSSV
jgi:hypothetical protein